MAKGAEKLLRLLNKVEEDRHTFNVELLCLDIPDNPFPIIGKSVLDSGSIIANMVGGFIGDCPSENMKK